MIKPPPLPKRKSTKSILKGMSQFSFLSNGIHCLSITIKSMTDYYRGIQKSNEYLILTSSLILDGGLACSPEKTVVKAVNFTRLFYNILKSGTCTCQQ